MLLLSQCFQALLSSFQDPWHVDGTLKKESGKELYFAFRRTLEAQIQFRAAIFCVAVGIFAGLAFYEGFPQESTVEWAYLDEDRYAACQDFGYPPVQPFAWQSDDPRSVYFISLLLIICTCGVFVVCALLMCNRFQRFTSWETAICFVICVWMYLLPIAASRQFAGTFGVNHIRGRWSHIQPPEAGEVDGMCIFAAWVDTDGVHNCTKVVLLMDGIVTGTCMYLPLRSISRFCLCFSAIIAPVVTSGIAGVHPELVLPQKAAHVWGVLWLLVLFSFKGATDKMSHRWQTWVSSWDLKEIVATQAATEKIARCLCDVVVSLASDLRLCGCGQELKSFLPHAVDGSLFTDHLSAPDVPRFNAMIDGVSRSEIAGCLSVSLLSSGMSPREANLLVVSSKGSHGLYLLGIAFPKEGLLPEAEGIASMPSPERIGAQLDEWDCLDSNPDQADSLTKLTLGTSEVFTEMNLDSIIELGLCEHWLLLRERIKVNYCDILGKGGFGIVYGGSFCGSEVAVKCQQHFDNENNLRPFRSFATEIRILRRLRHPNIVLFHGACVESTGSITLILERVLGQSLNCFSKGRQIPLMQQANIMHGITSALWYLHEFSPSVVHGDLKPDNIMIEVKIPGVGSKLTPCAKLIDFGLSTVLSRGVKSAGGTKDWQAPEIYMSRTTPTSSADVFSFGCVMFFIMTGHKPFSKLECMLDSGCFPSLPWPASSLHPKELGLICQLCVGLDAAARPSIEEVWTWMQDIRLSDLDTVRKLTESI